MNKQCSVNHTSAFGKGRHSIGRSLLTWFLLLALVPLILTAWLGYRQAVDGLMATTTQGLEEGAQLKAQFIQNWFDYRLMDLNSQAKNRRNTGLLMALQKGFEASGKGLDKFVKSPAWFSLVSGWQQNLIAFTNDYDYIYDVFLIDSDGNILFTVAHESDLGTNLFDGSYAATRFAHSAKSSLENGQILFSDLERYAPSNNLMAGFIIAPVLDDRGNKLGLFAIQLQLNRIQHIMGNQGIESSLNHYLVGEDGLLRTALKGMAEETVLTKSVETEQFDIWLREHGTHGERPFDMHETAFIYRGINGQQVIGIHHSVNLPGVHWGLISEIDQNEALAIAHSQAKTTLTILLLTGLMVVCLAVYLARRLSQPIIQLAEASLAAAAGKLDQQVSIEDDNEIGILGEAFNHMLATRQKHLDDLEQSNRKATRALADLAEQKFALDQHAIVAITNVQGDITYANDLFSIISGFSRDELLGANHRLMKSGQHDTAFFRNMYRTIGKGKVWHGEICNKTKDGHLYWLETSIVPFLGENGKPKSYISIRTDITERKCIEQSLERERQFNQLTLDAIPAEIIVMDEYGKAIYVNDSWQQSDVNTDESANNIIGKNFIARIESTNTFCTKNRKIIHRHLIAMLHGEYNRFSEEISCTIADKQQWYVVRAASFSEETQRRIVLARIDITDQKMAELALQREKETAQRYLNVAGVMLLVVDADETVSLVNRWGCALLGLPEEKIVGRNWFNDFVSEHDQDSARANFNDLLTGNLDIWNSQETTLRCHNLDDCLMSWQSQPLRDIDGIVTGILFSGEDITERKRAEHALRNSEERIRSLLMSTGEAIYGIDLNGNCTFVNAACIRILGYEDASELMGKNMHELAHHSHADGTPYPKAECPIARALNKGKGFHVSDEMFWRKNGEGFPVEYRSEPVRRDREIIGAAVSFSDISERLLMIQELQSAKDAAEQASHTKSAFLATMSHEIRTPMNGVVGMIDVLRRTELDESQQEMIHGVRESAYTLLRIIDDILDFSKIEAGRLELEQVPVSLEQLVETVADNILPMAVQKDIELVLYCQPSLPIVIGDPVRIRQILFNLIGNAIKFTSADPEKLRRVFIGVELASINQDQAAVDLWVKDNGIGMKPEAQEQLFQPFAQGEGSITRRFGGTGLGLSICKRLAKIMGGNVEVESEEGVGSTFTVHLTLDIAHDEAPQATLDLSGVNILVASNDNDNISVWKSYLKHAGASVVVAGSEETIVAHALGLAAKKDDLIVIIDTEHTGHNMPSADKIRGLLRKKTQPKLLHFVLMRHGRRRNARQTADDSLELDLNAMRRMDFLRAVAAACSRVSLPDKGPKASVDEYIPPICLTRDEAAATGRLILVAEDNEINQDVLTMQLSILGLTADMAADGKEALELWRKGQYALLLTDCHMPEMDGYTLVRAIREEEKDGQHIPIMAITADALKGTQERCREAGMDDYLAKPVQLNVLEQKLSIWLDMDKCDDAAT